MYRGEEGIAVGGPTSGGVDNGPLCWRRAGRGRSAPPPPTCISPLCFYAPRDPLRLLIIVVPMEEKEPGLPSFIRLLIWTKERAGWMHMVAMQPKVIISSQYMIKNRCGGAGKKGKEGSNRQSLSRGGRKTRKQSLLLPSPSSPFIRRVKKRGDGSC